MSVGEAILDNFDLYRWNADVYGAMALASRLAVLVKDRAETVTLASKLRRLNSLLSELFDEIYKAIERGEIRRRPGITPEVILGASGILLQLHDLLDSMYRVCKRARLTNNSATAAALKSISDYTEEIKELSDLLKLSLDPGALELI
ncbi:MAG: hypothetical protein ACRD4S_06520, partial [Candidatus Acidiferrales bacterium]